MEAHPRPDTARKATRHWPLVSGLAAVAIAVALGSLILLRHNGPFLIDQSWMTEVVEDRTGWLEVPALILNFVGGGWFATILVPVVTIVILLFLKRRWAAAYYAIAVAFSALSVQLLKALFDRPRPEEILIVSDFGSFPSGHVTNAATIVVSLAILIGRTWVWYVGVVYVVLMALSRTYLGAHWVTDTIGGALLGAGVAVIVWAPLAVRLNREREQLQTTKSASTLK
ncbi:MAG: phosphatase PAP2 family protein [Terrimesophilobacter sp.]